MNLREALLLSLPKRGLLKVAESVGVKDLELLEADEIADALNRVEAATSTRLLAELPEGRITAVCRYAGLPEPCTRETLARAAGVYGEAAVADPPIQYVAKGPLPVGALVRWGERLGVIEWTDGRQIKVRFDGGEVLKFSVSGNTLERVGFGPGAQVTRRGDETIGVVLTAAAASGYPTWIVSFPGGAPTSVVESGLRPAVVSDPVERIKSGELGVADDFHLRCVAADYWTAHMHNPLVSLSSSRVDLKPHQVAVVHRVISSYPHRFLLCDEVGLGKTIEAAMVIKELRARGEARRVLILVPSGLMRQWQFELKSKFNMTFAIYGSGTLKFLKDNKGSANPWSDNDSIIASHTWASWTVERRQEIASVDWDMVVVDEAHHARVHEWGESSSRTKLFELVRELVGRPEQARRPVLFLTATPLQLERYELYSLVEMLDPVLFSSEKDFEKHIEELAGLNQTVERLERPEPEDDPEALLAEVARLLQVSVADARTLLILNGKPEVAEILRAKHRLSEVLIRNRKSVVRGFQPRRAYRWPVEMSTTEREIYELMGDIVRRGMRVARERKSNAIGFLMVILHKLLASSSRALLTSLRKRQKRNAGQGNLDENEAEDAIGADLPASEVIDDLTAKGADDELGDIGKIIRLLETITIDSKAAVLEKQLASLFVEEPDAKVLVFTEFRETQEMLAELLSTRWNVEKFHGQLSPDEKDRAVDRIRNGDGPQVLVSTEAGGEGRNLQFCHVLINYDLPWNPMRVEQRIGRVDRIGQEHPVTIFNFDVQGTIEGRILDVLERRIGLFEEAIGSLEAILGETESDIVAALRLSKKEQAEALTHLGDTLEEKISAAKEAESKLHDFILQDKSYGAEIARVASQQEAPISQSDFERFLLKLLESIDTYVGAENSRGERRIVFQGPFLIDHADLVNAQDSRRVSFNPLRAVDSELVEYLGFGHPIVDYLIQRATTERHDGAAVVRRAPWVGQPGWQFVFLLTVRGMADRTTVNSIFVPDGGDPSLELGQALLTASRAFDPKENDASQPNLELIDDALVRAEGSLAEVRDAELQSVQLDAEARADVEEERLRSLIEHRERAAKDRVESCERTLARIKDSTDPQVRRVIPVWEANLARALSELDALGADLARGLIALGKRRNPTAETLLLAIARVQVAGGEAVG